MSIYTFIQQGGTVAWAICIMSIAGIWQICWKLITIHRFWKQQRKLLPETILNNLQNIDAHQSVILELIRTELSCAFAPLEKGLTTISTIAALAPLLGLLGTVMGVFQAFGAMSLHGSTDPALLAGGIKLALITTIIGLVVAIPHVVGYNYFISTIDTERTEVENEVLKRLERKMAERR